MTAATTPSPQLPLAGVVVLDLTWLLPGPFSTHVLAELGAEVIKVERPEGGDYLRDLLPQTYRLINRGKKSVAVDLKSRVGKALFDEMAAECDVVVEAFRPGVAKKLGVDYESLSARNPALVYLSISGYGQTGPMAAAAGHDLNFLALAGALSIPGHWGEMPRRSGLPVADLAASLYGAINVLAALKARDSTGRGAYIDLAIADAVLHWTQVRFAERGDATNWPHVWPGNDVFETQDGHPLALGIVETKFWKNFGEATTWADAESLSREFEHAVSAVKRRKLGDLLRHSVAERVAQQNLAYWTRVLTAHDVPYAVVNDSTTVFQEPHFHHRGMLTTIPGENGTTITAVTFPGRAYRGAKGNAPQLDEHGQKIRASKVARNS